MALLFNYSLNNLTLSAQLPGWFAGITGTPTLGVGDGPQGINTIHCNGNVNGYTLVPNIAIPINGNGLIVGAGFNITGGFSGQTGLFGIGGIGTGNYSTQVGVSNDGSLQFFTYGQAQHSSASGVFSFGTRHEIEVKISSFAAAGVVTLYLDGVAVTGLTAINLPFLVNAQDGATIHTVCVGGSSYGGFAGSTQLVDSVYAMDTSGAIDNAPVGVAISIPYTPLGAGNKTQWAVTGAANGYQALQNIPANSSEYISSGTPGQEETVTLTNLLGITLSSVYGVCIGASQEEDTPGGGRSTTLGVGNGTTQNYGTIYNDWPLGTTYAYNATPFSENPFTATNWAPVDLATLEAAVKLLT